MKKRALSFAIFCLLAFSSFFVYKRHFSRDYLTVIGYVQVADGLGRQTVELIDALKDDVSINFIPTQKTVLRDVPAGVRSIISKETTKLGKVVIFEDAVWRPGYNAYKKLKTPKSRDQIRIAYSVFESSAIPNEWVTILNSYFDAVVVPDPYLVETYENSGVRLPIFVLPLGLDLQAFFDEPLKKQAGTPFVFANLSTCTDRKNQIALVKAFAKAFGNDDRVSLLINCRICTDGTQGKLKEEIIRQGLTNVHFSNLSLDNAAYLRLFKTVDCYVNLSKGEGFSIQPREAMALGIPVIAADNTAQTTICKSSYAVAVPSTALEPATYPWGATYGNFYLCDWEKAAVAMQEVYRNYPSFLKRSQEMRHWVEQYQYKNLKDYYKSLVKPKKVILGTENKITPDYIMTTSKKLFTKYNSL